MKTFFVILAFVWAAFAVGGVIDLKDRVADLEQRLSALPSPPEKE